VVVPNAKLSDSTVEVLPQNESIRIETQFSAPSGEPPQRVAELVTDVVNDLPQVDATRAVTVHPTDVAGPSTRYRLRCWVRRYHDMSEVEGEIQLRLWYVFQRHRLLALPENKEPGTASSAFLRSPRSLESLVAEGLEANGWPAAEAASAAPPLAAQGLLLLFAPGERLALPDDLENWAPMILHGQAAALQTSGLADRERRDGLAAGPASRAAALHAVARELAGYIGPYAERAVNRAAGIARADLAALCRMVAEEIPDEADRNRFLERTVPDESRFFGAGSLLAPGKDGVGLMAGGDPLRAVTELQVLALPEPPSRRKAGSITPLPTSAAG
jgi:hypothetical protein